MLSVLLDIFIPPRKTERLVRTLSASALSQLPQRTQRDTLILLPYHDARAAALVWELKYHQNAQAVRLAAALLSEPLELLAAEHIGRPLLIPIPIHPTRLKERGLNQSAAICEAVLNQCKRLRQEHEPLFEYAPDALMRTRACVPQQTLPRSARLQNVHNSMQIKNPSAVAGRVCIVVDDVTTTGATFAEARRALQEAGAEDVLCVALAG